MSRTSRAMMVLLLIMLAACGGALSTSPTRTPAPVNCKLDTHCLNELVTDGDALNDEFAICFDPQLHGGPYPRATATSIAIGCATISAQRSQLVATASAAAATLRVIQK